MNELFEKLVKWSLYVFGFDYLVDVRDETYDSEQYTSKGKRTEIDVLDCHGIYIENTGTGRVRLFDHLWLKPGQVWTQTNDHYKKFARRIKLQLYDPELDPESNPEGGGVSALTYRVCVVKTQLSYER